MRCTTIVIVSVATLCSFASAQNPPASNPQALSIAAQSIAALTGGNVINDVTLNGSATWTSGSDTETGSATLLASGTNESRIDLALSSATRTEIRDAQTGPKLGRWNVQNASSGKFAFHNCLTDAVWFFPALGSLAGSSNIVFSYVGQETRNGAAVQHVQTYVFQPSPSASRVNVLQQLSTMDFYLDATTFLPSAITFSMHPDNDTGTNIPVEIDFSNYQAFSGAQVPTHIQKYLQGTLLIDLSVSAATFNTGIPLSDFTIN
jgi:hypothetical protein